MREKVLTRPKISCFGNAFGKGATGFFFNYRGYFTENLGLKPRLLRTAFLFIATNCYKVLEFLHDSTRVQVKR